jgi:tRNA-modifying protein YgfZ
MTPGGHTAAPAAWLAGRTVAWACECGVLQVEGKDAVDLLHRLSTNDLRPLKSPRFVRSTVLTTAKGRMVDWCWVVAREQDLLLVTSPGRAGRVHEWLERYTILEDVRSTDVSAGWRTIVVQGLAAHGVTGLSELPTAGSVRELGGGYWWRGLPSATPRLEGLVPAEVASAVLKRVVEGGAELLDAAAVELVRIVNGIPSPSFEFRDEVNPLELRLARTAVSFDKGCYIGQEVIARLDTYDKLTRVLMGFDCASSPPQGAALEIAEAGQAVGRVTSLASWPTGGGVGLAVVKREAASEGEAEIEWLGGRAPVVLRDRPFWKS